MRLVDFERSLRFILDSAANTVFSVVRSEGVIEG